jgi:pimeloyl-ACP methyl ester carboxylesterase
MPVNRPLSQLVYARIQEGAGSPRLITLHQHRQYASDVAAYGTAAAPTGRVIGLESYKGVYVGRTIVGYTWFIGPSDHPSPIYFGDALAEIERFLWDEIDRQAASRAELPFLLGVGQGAIMALAAAGAVPDLLSGVIAVNGTLPVVPGWEPPLAPLDGLPVLLLDPVSAADAPDGVLAGESLVTTLQQWGAVVTRQIAPVGEIPGVTMSGWLNAQAIRHRTPEPTSS